MKIRRNSFGTTVLRRSEMWTESFNGVVYNICIIIMAFT